MDSPSKSKDPTAKTACDLVRRWFRTEAALSDAEGYVKNHERGQVIPPHNGICSRVLASREGFRRCNQSVKQTVKRMNQASANQPAADERTIQPCHLGLSIVATRLDGRPDEVGFCCGVSQRPLDAPYRRIISDKLGSIGVEPSRVEGWDDIPVLDAVSQERLLDLLEVAAGELATKWDDEPRIEEAEEISEMSATMSPALVGNMVSSAHNDALFHEQLKLHVAPKVSEEMALADKSAHDAGDQDKPSELNLKEQIQLVERDIIQRGLIKTHWNRTKLAQILGISRTSLLYKIDLYGLNNDGKPEQELE